MNQSDPSASSTHSGALRPDWIGLSWGFLEAVTLFVVPDTWITRQAFLSRRAGLIAAGWSLIGAMIGGLALHLLAMHYQSEILAFYDWLPGIGPTLTAKALSQLNENGVLALFLGGYTGTPFKLFAAQAHSAGIGFLTFATVAAISRGSRFLFSSLAASLISSVAMSLGGSRRAILWGHAFAWAAFYAWYWTAMAE